ncbi:DUF349 domain-containing protein [Thiohalocapsa marina]|uniref:DUF349 domain-containing protein n=1 Tax=Thiohalocapsa marina TaxID=424902 RepID=UPI0036D7E322
MFFKRLFGTRADATAATDPSRLLDIALTDPDSAARRDACRALSDLATLRRVSEQDPDAGVRDLANARYRRLLSGADDQAPSLDARLAELARIASPALLALVARQGDEAQLRLTAIQAVTDEAVLADCALQDPLASNRLQAAERVQGRDALEQILRGIGNRDKRVYRLAKARLKAIAERAERAHLVTARCEGICDKLSRLGRFDTWAQDHALLIHLDQQWAEIEGELGPDQQERRRRLRQAFLDGYERQARARAEAEAAKRAAPEVPPETPPDIQPKSQPRAQPEAQPKTLSETPVDPTRQSSQPLSSAPAPEPPADGPAGRSPEAPPAAAPETSAHAALPPSRVETAAALHADIRAALEQDAGPGRRRLADLRRRLAQLPAEDAEVAACGADLDRLQQRLERQRHRLEQKLAAVPERMRQLDELVEQGRLKQAESVYQSLAATLEHARQAGLRQAESSAAETHLKTVAPRLRELQHWRRWSADTHREQLCAEIEALAADAEHPLEPAANRLHELQAAWRGFDRNGAPADEALWQRFHAAAEQVQQRCRPFLDAQAKLRAASQAQREALCRQLEAFLAQVDWQRVDWKKAARAHREMRQAWAALGPVAHARHRALEGRFRKSLRRLEKALDEERARNTALKQDLIERMRTLVDEPDLGTAIAAAKALQQQWATTVPNRQRDENALWKAFRRASDAVFERRAAQHAARDNAWREHLATRQAICAELEQEAGAAADAAALQRALDASERRWQDTEALPLPRDAAAALRRRWETAATAARERRDALRDAERWAALAQVQARADLCDQAARRLVEASGGDDPEAPEALARQWAALPPLAGPESGSDPDTVEPSPADAPMDGPRTQGPPAEDALADRLEAAFQQVLRATRGQARDALQQQMQDNARRRVALCLQLEISSGVDSPAELQSERMALQVSRLREHLEDQHRREPHRDIRDGADDAPGHSDVWTLLQDWYRATPAADVDGLDVRFARVRQALQRR